MPIIDAFIVAAIVAAFVIFGGALAWAEYQTAPAAAIEMLRSNDLVWSRVVHDYLLGKRQRITDLMAWNADANSYAVPHAFRVSPSALSQQ